MFLLEQSMVVENTALMFGLQETLSSLSCDLVETIDEEDPPSSRRLLHGTADNDAGFHGRVIEQVWAKAQHAFQNIRLNKLAPHLRFFIAKEHSVGEQDRAAPCPRIQALQDMLEECIVSTALWWGAQEVSTPRITLPCLTIPLL